MASGIDGDDENSRGDSADVAGVAGVKEAARMVSPSIAASIRDCRGGTTAGEVDCTTAGGEDRATSRWAPNARGSNADVTKSTALVGRFAFCVKDSRVVRTLTYASAAVVFCCSARSWF